MFLIRSWRGASTVAAIKKGDPVFLRIALVSHEQSAVQL